MFISLLLTLKLLDAAAGARQALRNNGTKMVPEDLKRRGEGGERRYLLLPIKMGTDHFSSANAKASGCRSGSLGGA